MKLQSIFLDIKQASNDFAVLEEITGILSSSLNMKDTLNQIFECLHGHLGITKGILTLRDLFTNDMYIELAFGLTQSEKQQSSFEAWRHLSETVGTSGETAIIEDLSKTDSPIAKTAKDTNGLSFICIPITISQENIGTLSIYSPFQSKDNIERHIRLLSMISLMIGQEVRLKRLLESEKEALRTENVQLKDVLKSKYNILNMVGKSSGMLQVYENISQVAHSNATVIIRGESGTGKELVAHAIHYNSPRAGQAFIKINCGAIPESLIESELFGYEKGAFTDAHEQKIGKFEASNGGTIFLDEVGELSPAMQVKLLRVLQEKEFERVGGITSIKINVRVITATNRDLEKELENGKFRKDLYYRLNVFPIFIPPLKERQSDILLLAEHFLERYAKENDKEIRRISSLAIDLLNSYHWPGNVRELENCIERAVLVCNGDTIQARHLPPSLQRSDTMNLPVDSTLSMADMIQSFERELIMDALKRTNGNKTKAADHLQTTPRILGYKIENLGIDFNKFKTTNTF